MPASGGDIGKRLRVLAALVAIAGCGTAFAHEVTVADLTVVHPRLIVASSDSETGYLFTTLVNKGMAAETLRAVLSNEARSIVIGDNVEEAFVSIPGNGTAQIGPSGVSVKFKGLSGPHFQESTIRLVLVFEHAGEVTADAVVEIHHEN